MNSITTISFDEFFYCPRREKFLIETHKALFAFKFTEEAKLLTPEQEAERKRKSLLAQHLANRIYSQRREAIKNSNKMKYAESLTNQYFI